MSTSNESKGDLGLKDFVALGYYAYLYGYPMADNYRVMYETTVLNRLPFNAFVGTARLYTHADTIVVAPNNDTAYSSAWLDLRAGPVLFEIPDIQNRYWNFQFVDAFTNNVHYVGSRLGTKSRRFSIAGPDYRGKRHTDAVPIDVPSNMLFLLGRTQVMAADGKKAEEATQEIMDQYKLTAPEQKNPLVYPFADAQSIKRAAYFFEYLNFCLTHFQGPQESEVDAELMGYLERINVGPNKKFDPRALGKAAMDALQQGIDLAEAQIEKWALDGTATLVNGWAMPNPKAQFFGRDEAAYEFRSTICRAGIYGNSPAEAVYPLSRCDKNGAALDASKRNYTMTFAEGALPPYDRGLGGFWSLTIYNSARFLVPNDKSVNLDDENADRGVYSLGDRSNLEPNADKSITIYVQKDAPKDRKAYNNWLPAPDGPFSLIVRVYCPNGSLLTRYPAQYELPPIVAVAG